MLAFRSAGAEVSERHEREAEHAAEAVTRTAGTPPGGLPAPHRRPPKLSPEADRIVGAPGVPLDPATRIFMESAYGRDLRHVRVHTGPDAAASARREGALAYTLGRHVVFGENRYAPGTDAGRRVLAHELAHVVQQTDAPGGAPGIRLSRLRGPALQRLGARHGQHVSGGQADLTADLTSPVVAGVPVRFESRWGYVPTLGVTDRVRYLWRIRDRDSGQVVSSRVTDSAAVSLRYPRPGRFRVEHSLLVGGHPGALTTGAREVGSVGMDQDAVAEDATVAQQSTDVRELVNSFRGYVIASATGTGPFGITPLFLASVLRMEIENTTPFGLQSTPGYRQREISTVQEAIEERRSGGSPDPDDLNRSVGVGQIRMSTAAALFGTIPWREQSRADRSVARSATAADYRALGAGSQQDVLDVLRWPKSNIETAAALLDRLKNRPHRYPTMDRAAFGSSQRAVQIIATEYNGGGTDTPEAQAGPNYYGRQIWTYMQEPFMQAQFPNT